MNDDIFWKIALESQPQQQAPFIDCPQELRRRKRQQLLLRTDGDDGDVGDEEEDYEEEGIGLEVDETGSQELLEQQRGLGRLCTYHIPIHDRHNDDPNSRASSTHPPQQLRYSELRLSPLPDACSAWAPVGSQVWHASAVLACLPVVFQPSPIGGVTTEQDEEENWILLELGSGAVGLAGMALAVASKATVCRNNGSNSKDDNFHHHRKRRIKCILTDLNEDGILQHLRQNVERNRAVLEDDTTTTTATTVHHRVNVEALELDWRARELPQDLLRALQIHHNHQRQGHRHGQLTIVGSELVYTDETARACASILTQLLRHRQEQCSQNNNNTIGDIINDTSVIILQVMDRPGWSEFLELLQQSLKPMGYRLRTAQPLPIEWHDRAVRLLCGSDENNNNNNNMNDITMVALGTLSWRDYGLLWIQHQSAMTAMANSKKHRGETPSLSSSFWNMTDNDESDVLEWTEL